MEHSFGIIVFQDNPRRYLVLIKKSGVDFPKGHPEGDETEEQTAMRETIEETGLTDVQLIPGYREEIQYSFTKGKAVTKKVTFFLGRTMTADVKISSEHKGFKWCTVEETIKKVYFKEQQQLIRKAEEHLKTVL